MLLSKGKLAKVDDADFDRVSAVPWTANFRSRSGGKWYAMRKDSYRGTINLRLTRTNQFST